MRGNSLLQPNEKKCYLCGYGYMLECHHIFNGANRTKSDTFGCWVWLCPDCHRGSKGVHGALGHEVNLLLKKQCQEAFEKRFPQISFIQRFGKNYK